uniref:Uncharacterized protein n=1 Tax=Cyanistes caeruleus TaxID=156563 RepID=A0A8C0U4F2_CYACU
SCDQPFGVVTVSSLGCCRLAMPAALHSSSTQPLVISGNKTSSAVSGSQILVERSSREGSAQRMSRQPSASRMQKAGTSGKNSGGGSST